MYTEQRLPVVEQILNIFDEFANTLDVVCRRGCSVCCTRNVTMTTLEGYRIHTYIRETGQSHLESAVAAAMEAPRFQPLATLNKMAEICAAGGDPPEERVDPDWTPCPLLENDCCTVYPARPLACRVMVSREVCTPQGSAGMDEFTLTMSHLFTQYLEHVDFKGLTGNLSDVLTLLADDEARGSYAAEGSVDAGASTLLHNRPVRILMIPPENRQQVQPWLERLNAIDA